MKYFESVFFDSCVFKKRKCAKPPNYYTTYKVFVSQKFDGIKDTGNSVRSNFYDVISYDNINAQPGNFLA